jgi:hypothetical protein
MVCHEILYRSHYYLSIKKQIEYLYKNKKDTTCASFFNVNIFFIFFSG